MKKWKKMLIAGALSLGLAIPGAVMTGCLGFGDTNVDLRVQDGYVQFYDGEEWKNLISVEELKGENDTVQNGEDGKDGREVEFRTSSTHIQWRYKTSDNSDTWKNLIALSELKGAPGDDGTSTYVHIRYADSQPTQNSDMKTTASNWIGIYSGTSSTAPTSYTAYTWYCIKGEVGENGEDGQDGKNGQNGISTYVHIRYSDNQPTQNSDIKATASDWIGIYSGISPTAPTSYSAYTWYCIKGADGQDGENGEDGVDATYATYTITFDYGAAADIFVTSPVSKTIKSTEWIIDLPKLYLPVYEESFRGWFVKGSDKKIENYDFIGGNVTLEARFDPEKLGFSGLYSNGKYVMSWDEIKTEYPSAIVDGEIVGKSSTSYFANLSGEMYLDAEVIKIGQSAFRNCSYITKVVLPEGLESIGDTAFQSCKKLTSINIPNTVASIGTSAFRYCNQLSGITLPDGLTSLEFAVFQDCAITSINIPNSVKTISNYALGGCVGLTNIEIPASVTYIGGQAFEQTSITELHIPSSVSQIKEGITRGCVALKTITVAPENEVYDSRNECNAIINKTTNALVAGCSTTKIPSTVTSIAKYAFAYCEELTNITLPDSVTSIGDYAFEYIPALNIVMSKNLTTIGSAAFQNVGLNIYYLGSSAEWENINNSDTSSAMKNATRYFYVSNQQDVPNDGGNYWHFAEDGITPVIWTSEEN